MSFTRTDIMSALALYFLMFVTFMIALPEDISIDLQEELRGYAHDALLCARWLLITWVPRLIYSLLRLELLVCALFFGPILAICDSPFSPPKHVVSQEQDKEEEEIEQLVEEAAAPEISSPGRTFTVPDDDDFDETREWFYDKEVPLTPKEFSALPEGTPEAEARIMLARISMISRWSSSPKLRNLEHEAAPTPSPTPKTDIVQAVEEAAPAEEEPVRAVEKVPGQSRNLKTSPIADWMRPQHRRQQLQAADLTLGTPTITSSISRAERIKQRNNLLQQQKAACSLQQVKATSSVPQSLRINQATTTNARKPVHKVSSTIPSILEIEAQQQGQEEARQDAEQIIQHQAQEALQREQEDEPCFAAEEVPRKPCQELAHKQAKERIEKQAEESARLENEELARKQAEHLAKQKAQQYAKREAEKLAKYKAQKEEQARREAQAQADRERIEAARRAHEQAEAERQEALRREQARREEELRAQAQAEQDRIEAERRAQQEEAERQAELQKQQRIQWERQQEAIRRAQQEEAERQAEFQRQQQAQWELEQEAAHQLQLRRAWEEEQRQIIQEQYRQAQEEEQRRATLAHHQALEEQERVILERQQIEAEQHRQAQEAQERQELEDQLLQALEEEQVLEQQRALAEQQALERRRTLAEQQRQAQEIQQRRESERQQQIEAAKLATQQFRAIEARNEHLAAQQSAANIDDDADRERLERPIAKCKRTKHQSFNEEPSNTSEAQTQHEQEDIFNIRDAVKKVVSLIEAKQGEASSEYTDLASKIANWIDEKWNNFPANQQELGEFMESLRSSAFRDECMYIINAMPSAWTHQTFRDNLSQGKCIAMFWKVFLTNVLGETKMQAGFKQLVEFWKMSAEQWNANPAFHTFMVNVMTDIKWYLEEFMFEKEQLRCLGEFARQTDMKRLVFDVCNGLHCIFTAPYASNRLGWNKQLCEIDATLVYAQKDVDKDMEKINQWLQEMIWLAQ